MIFTKFSIVLPCVLLSSSSDKSGQSACIIVFAVVIGVSVAFPSVLIAAAFTYAAHHGSEPCVSRI